MYTLCELQKYKNVMISENIGLDDRHLSRGRGRPLLPGSALSADQPDPNICQGYFLRNIFRVLHLHWFVHFVYYLCRTSYFPGHSWKMSFPWCGISEEKIPIYIVGITYNINGNFVKYAYFQSKLSLFSPAYYWGWYPPKRFAVFLCFYDMRATHNKGLCVFTNFNHMSLVTLCSEWYTCPMTCEKIPGKVIVFFDQGVANKILCS